jgi:hypothetical protein
LSDWTRWMNPLGWIDLGQSSVIAWSSLRCALVPLAVGCIAWLLRGQLRFRSARNA